MFKEQEISFNTAVLAKEKGFEQKHIEEHYLKDENLDTSNMAWQNGLSLGSAPSQSVLQKWLREKHNIPIAVDFKLDKHPKLNYFSLIYDVKNYHIIHVKKLHDTYEKALEESLFKALTLI